MCDLGFGNMPHRKLKDLLFSGLMETTAMFANIGENLEHSKT
jgi:hypothetical protein